ncbi:uncharacterized protein LOC126563466 [Anopheles maculipalpis]|uniref:uncharacterized protein LOC126563466 n=1 Tax=Anopheles maculipalpis TaxID=1496333 RepID=UPI0021592037|nr:uncharacterized protein LOC126563466 [Anopheles maculipalpis]
MALSGKLLIPLFGVVLLCGVVFAAELNYDDINSLPTEEKRRIIRELLRAQRDIRGALLKIHYSLNGEEFDADGNEDPYWQGCWDKELEGYRQSIEAKMSSLASGLQQAHSLMDEINERVKPHWYGHHKPGYGGSYGGGEYGPPGYGPGYGPDYEGGYRPTTSPPLSTSYRPTTTDSYNPGGDDDDDYYARNRPVGGNRRYGRELDLSKQTEPEATQAEVKVEKTVDPIEESAVIDALEQLSEAKQ